MGAAIILPNMGYSLIKSGGGLKKIGEAISGSGIKGIT